MSDGASLPLTLLISDIHFTSDTEFVTVAWDGAVYEWELPPLNADAMLDWVVENRYLPDFTCDQREQYRIEPLCEAEEES